MSKTVFCPDWKEKVAFSDEGPCPQILVETEKVKVVLAGLEPGHSIPPHPEVSAVFYFLEGTGWMVIDGERLAVGPGSIVVANAGSTRGVEAESRLVFSAVRIP